LFQLGLQHRAQNEQAIMAVPVPVGGQQGTRIDNLSELTQGLFLIAAMSTRLPQKIERTVLLSLAEAAAHLKAKLAQKVPAGGLHRVCKLPTAVVG
jgi:hypothetical protein